MIKPEVEYKITTRLYSQRTIIELLGLNTNKDQTHRIYCDGDNKVRIESWTSK
jgi:hypothetical protein